MPLSECTPSDAQDTTWDVVVVGTGAGGGPAGLSLAKRGKSVLFVERGAAWDLLSVKVATLSVLGRQGHHVPWFHQ
jgi:choline dehydrogenase-like flavoprotein